MNHTDLCQLLLIMVSLASCFRSVLQTVSINWIFPLELLQQRRCAIMLS